MDASPVLRASALLGLSSSLWLSGIYFSASQLTLPLLYRLPAETSTKVFTELYYRGAKTIVPLALLSTASTGLSAYLDPDNHLKYAVAAAATISSLAFTAAAMTPTIDRLIAISKDTTVMVKSAASGEIETLLRRWKWMNNVRAGLCAVGGVLALLVASRTL
jgi:hypothetical protein